MRRFVSLLPVIVILLILFIVVPKAKADICYDNRIVYQWACTTQPCPGSWVCSNGPGISCEQGINTPCEAIPYGNQTCVRLCDGFPPTETCVNTGSTLVNCSDPPSCAYTGGITQCSIQSGSCTEQNLTYGCWGPGGASPSPGGSSPTPQISCGDGHCDTGEDCTCSADCGPPPTSCNPPSPAPGAPIGQIQTTVSVCEGTAVNVTGTGQDADGNLTSVQVWYSPVSSVQGWVQIGTDITPASNPSTCNGSSCTGTRSWTPPVTGVSTDYYVVTNAYDSTSLKCTGNTIDDGTTSLWGTVNPGGPWTDCGATSRTQVTVAPCATGNIRVRAVQVPANSTCPFGGSVTALPAGSVDYSLTLQSPLTTTNSTETLGDLNYTTTSHQVGSYTLVPGSINGYYNSLNCFQNTTYPGWAAGTTADLDTSGITWDVGYSLAQNWFQVAGGNVHSNRGVSVKLPQFGTQFLLPLTGGTGKSGLVSSVNPLNFGSNVTTAKDAVSAGLITTEGVHPFDAANPSYYEYYWQRFQNEAINIDSLTPPTYMNLSDLQDGRVYVTNKGPFLTLSPGSMTGPYFNNRKVILFVNNASQVLLNTGIMIANNGLFVIIARNTIRFSVSTPPSRPLMNASQIDLSSPQYPPQQLTPWFSGIYITDGAIQIVDTDSSDGRDQAVMAGTYVANTFDFSGVSIGTQAQTYAPVIFAYRADLWKNAPAKLKEIDLTWKEETP